MKIIISVRLKNDYCKIVIITFTINFFILYLNKFSSVKPVSEGTKKFATKRNLYFIIKIRLKALGFMT